MPSNQHHPHGRCCNYITCVKRSKRSNRVASHAASASIAAQAAVAISSSAINLASNVSTQLNSVEEINTAPTSYTQNGPAWKGSTVTAPWTGLSTAEATVSGSYDGSDGQGILTFEVRRAGTHGEHDLRIRVLGPDGSNIENINIDKHDPQNQVYVLSNGLTISLGAGDLIKNDTFEVDTTLVSTSYAPNNPGWTGATAAPTIGGAYDGSNGTGDLKFLVNRNGVHGEDDLRIRVYDPNDSLIDTINISKNDPINKVYSLDNGLTLAFGDGELVRNESFLVSVDALDPNNYTTTPQWEYGSSTATLSGDYDGSGGSGTLTFKALDNGVHGADDPRVRVYNPNGSTLETIDIDKNDPISQSYGLSNGLLVTFSAGEMIKNETFAVDIQDLSISSGETGFFEVLRIDDGLYEHVEGTQYASRRSGYSASGRRITLAAMEDLARRMNTLFDDANRSQAEPYLDQIRNDLKAAIVEAFKSTSDKIGSDLGIAFDFLEPRQEVFRFSKKNQERFSASLKTFRGAETFQNLFFGESKRDEGLVDRLLSITRVAEQNLIQTSGNSGMFVDVLA